MQKNDFEKNVQQRMDELQLYPSAELWPEVERRIRKEKKRRWIIFWFLFPLLLTGTGTAIYFLTKTGRKNISADQNQSLIEKPIAEKNKESLTVKDQTVTTTAKDSIGAGNKIPSADEISKTGQANIESGRKQPLKNDQPIVAIEKNNGAKGKKSKPGSDKARPTGIVSNVIPKTVDTLTTGKVLPVSEVVKNDVSPKDLDTADQSLAIVNEIKLPVDAVKTEQPQPIVPDTDSSISIDKPNSVAEKKTTKWKMGVTLIAGLSNRAGELSLGAEKNDRYSSSIGGGGTGGPPQLASYTTIDEGKLKPYFEAGAYLKSESKKRTSVSFGLSLSSFAHGQNVGTFRDSVLNADADGYYRPGNSSVYNNRYYYLQMPVMFHWQVNKGNKFPLIWQNGFSPSFLLGSNALIYNDARSIYYRDKSPLNKVQFAFRSGLYSRFAKASKHPLSAGLFLNYNLSGFQKTNQYSQNHHLSFGIQLMLQLKKD